MVAVFFGADELQASGQTGRVAEKQNRRRADDLQRTSGRNEGGRFFKALPFVVPDVRADCISLHGEML